MNDYVFKEIYPTELGDDVKDMWKGAAEFVCNDCIPNDIVEQIKIMWNDSACKERYNELNEKVIPATTKTYTRVDIDSLMIWTEY